MRIFVFGSNKAGIHGAGAALYAKNFYGAVTGIGEGITGDSYALPTKGFHIETLPLFEIRHSVNRFIEVAEFWALRGAEFQVTRVGCGLGGKKDSDIAPMFKSTPDNCLFDTHWQKYLDVDGIERRYW